MHNWDKPPIGPLYSVGDVSAKNFGQNKENKPAAAPKRIRPNKNTQKLEKRQIKEPAITKILVRRIQFLLPITITGPPNNAPNADPAIVKV